ncbi:MAG: ABC transporter substrate-binding protein, partial [Bacillota bacterium]|nr:ABC transporter substrate-binding protein [Bacillota bacterium]
VDPAERVAIYQQVQKLMAEELPYLYLWYPVDHVVYETSLHLPKGSYGVKGLYTDQWYVSR